MTEQGMDKRETKAIIEGLLFLWGDPLASKDMAKILGLDEAQVEDLLQEMREEFDQAGRGLAIRPYGEGWQLTTRPEYAPYYEQLATRPKKNRLANSTLETLSIIAYKQPVTRVEVDNIRGVKSSSSINTLLSKGYIEEVGRLDQVGRPIIYQTSQKFLQDFNLESLDQLPDFEASRARLEALEEEENGQAGEKSGHNQEGQGQTRQDPGPEGGLDHED